MCHVDRTSLKRVPCRVHQSTLKVFSCAQLSLGKPSDSPPAPTAVPSPFAHAPLSPFPSSSRGSSPRSYSPRAAASAPMSPAIASATAATALLVPTPQQACFAALQQQLQLQHSLPVRFV